MEMRIGIRRSLKLPIPIQILIPNFHFFFHFYLNFHIHFRFLPSHFPADQLHAVFFELFPLAVEIGAEVIQQDAVVVGAGLVNAQLVIGLFGIEVFIIYEPHFRTLALTAVFGKDSIVGIYLHVVTHGDRGVVVDGQVVGCTRRCKKHFDLLEVKLLLGHVLGLGVKAFRAVEEAVLAVDWITP